MSLSTASFLKGALTFTAALAWNQSVKSAIDTIYPLDKGGNDEGVKNAMAHIMYAVFVTIVVLVILHIMNIATSKSNEQNNKGNNKYYYSRPDGSIVYKHPDDVTEYSRNTNQSQLEPSPTSTQPLSQSQLEPSPTSTQPLSQSPSQSSQPDIDNYYSYYYFLR